MNDDYRATGRTTRMIQRAYEQACATEQTVVIVAAQIQQQRLLKEMWADITGGSERDVRFVTIDRLPRPGPNVFTDHYATDCVLDRIGPRTGFRPASFEWDDPWIN